MTTLSGKSLFDYKLISNCPVTFVVPKYFDTEWGDLLWASLTEEFDDDVKAVSYAKLFCCVSEKQEVHQAFTIMQLLPRFLDKSIA